MENNTLGYEIERTILNDIEETEGFIKLDLTSGETLYGQSDVILFESDDDDDECVEETEYLRFLPYKKSQARYLKEEDIKTFESCTENDIPKE